MTFTRKYIRPGVKLFDNQRYNVSELIKRRRALLTDRVGSGKTLSILFAYSVLKEAGKLSNLIVMTPLSAYEKETWKQDIKKFTLFTSISLDELYKICGDSQDKLVKCLQQYNVVYCKHSHSKSHLEFLERIASVPDALLCIDEAHAMRNPKSAMTLAVRQVASHVKNLWGLTGSSVSRSIEDLYHIVNLIYPWYLGSFLQFRDIYCLTKNKIIPVSGGRRRVVPQIIGVKDEEEFQRKLAPLVITGDSFLDVKFHYMDYVLSPEESEIYKKIAKGIGLEETTTPEDWISYILSNTVETEPPRIKDVNFYSSRFIYLQSAADGTLNSDGTLTRQSSTKMDMLLDKLREIVNKGQSCIVYFDYYTPLYAVQSYIQRSGLKCAVLVSSGNHVLKAADVTEAKCKRIPHIILGTRASSESVSYYFINNVIFFNIPTVPSTMTQLVGRITRKSTLYPDDLNCYIFRSTNIDLYKLIVVSAKTYQMELVQGKERNVPDDYKMELTRTDNLDKYKRVLLWNK